MTSLKTRLERDGKTAPLDVKAKVKKSISPAPLTPAPKVARAPNSQKHFNRIRRVVFRADTNLQLQLHLLRLSRAN
jgi:hypothetical protein